MALVADLAAMFGGSRLDRGADGGRVAVAFFERSSRVGAVGDVSAKPGDSGLFVRSATHRSIFHRASYPHPGGRHSRTITTCRDRGRGCPVLRASRSRLHRHAPCGLDESAPRGQGRGGQHHYPTVGAVAVSLVRTHLRPQSARAHSGLQNGIGPDEGANSRTVFESDLLRTRRLWCRLGGSNIFWERSLRPHGWRLGLSRGSSEIAEPLFALQGL